MKRALPILVVGINRSGTKWLSNILCNSPEISGNQRDRNASGGIMETNLFGNLQRAFPSLSAPDDYVAFIELWSAGDFFQNTGIEKDFLYSLKPRPKRILGVFKAVMEELAHRNETRFWLQKTSPYQAETACSEFPEARVIIMHRPFIETLRSQVAGMRQSGIRGLVIRETFFFVMQSKILKSIRRRHADRVSSLSYCSLKSDPDRVVSQLCSDLGIPFSAEMLDVKYERNTSFKSETDRLKGLSRGELLSAKLFYICFYTMPLSLMNIMKSLLGKSDRLLVPGSFGWKKDKYHVFN